MTEVPVNSTLGAVTDEYLLQRNISNRKYLAGYLNSAKWAWRELFQNTIYSVQSEWQPLRKGEPYNYVNVPAGMQRLFTVSVTDKCGSIVPLSYNNYLNVVQKPKVNTCGCKGNCGCEGGLCEDIAGLTKITKLLFTISGADYFETTWLELCPNGDILEYRKVPVKSYNNYTGDGGDYNADYNNDYLIANPPFSDYTIVYKEFQNILCKLDVQACGCPENTTENENLFLQHCGGYCQPFVNCGKIRNVCEQFSKDTNYNACLGTVKMSECGTRIYYKPHPTERGQVAPKLPEYLLINYQTTGENCTTEVVIPEYAIETMFYGIHFKSTRFNMSINPKEKKQIEYDWINSQNKLILYLSNFNMDKIATVQDIPILF